MREIAIRSAVHAERASLEALQWRASLANSGDRDALLANPDAIALPIEQIATDCVFVAERDGVVAGFAAVVPRPDGGAELDALFVHAEGFYVSCGFRVIGTVETRFGVGFDMRRSL